MFFLSDPCQISSEKVTRVWAHPVIIHDPPPPQLRYSIGESVRQVVHDRCD